jgi:nucleoside-diphosphate-sugar epimerase
MHNWNSLFGDQFKNVNALVTGGAGFIGGHLSEALLTLGAKVVILDDMSGGLESNIQLLKNKFADRVEFINGSILDPAALTRATRNCKYVFHQAALGSVPRSMEQPELYLNVNIIGTLKVLQAAKEAGVARVMFAASSSAYGDAPTLPKHEEMPVSPLSPYAVSKVAGEGLMRTFALGYGLDTASLRYFNIFGPRQNANSAYAAVIAAFAKALAAGKAPFIFGDGTQSRDFTYVENAVYANLLAAASTTPIRGETLNVACALQVSVSELAIQMCKMYGRPDLSPAYGPVRAGDVLHSLACLDKTKRILGYKPIVDFVSGLDRTVTWYRQN